MPCRLSTISERGIAARARMRLASRADRPVTGWPSIANRPSPAKMSREAGDDEDDDDEDDEDDEDEEEEEEEAEVAEVGTGDVALKGDAGPSREVGAVVLVTALSRRHKRVRPPRRTCCGPMSKTRPPAGDEAGSPPSPSGCFSKRGGGGR
jgi:hypothetical protein